MKLTERERRFLDLLMDEGSTIARGTETGRALCRRGLLHVAKPGRYGITPAGVQAYRDQFVSDRAQGRAKMLKDAQLELI